MSNKKYSKRIVKNQSMNMNNATSKTWRNDDGSYTTAIPVPTFMFNETHSKLLLYMASYLFQYMEKENIKSCKQWDKLQDDRDFQIKTVDRILNDYGKICCYHLHIDMIEHAPILLYCVTQLGIVSKNFFDGFVTASTKFKYEWLPILTGIVININRNIEFYAPLYIEGYNKLMNEQKVA